MRYRVTLRQNAYCYAACGLMLAAAALRLCHFLPRWGETAPLTLAAQLFLPLAANLVFCYGALAKRGRLYLLTVLSVFFGVLFFIIKAQGFERAWHTVLCTLLYMLVFMLYTLTALGVLPSLWPLRLVFGLPFLYHGLRDLAAPPAYFATAPLPELSVLCILGALLCVSFAFRLDKIKNKKKS